MGDRDVGAEYLRALARIGRRARGAVVLRRLVPAALAGLGAGLLHLAARPFLPPWLVPGHPLLVPGLLLGVALAAGTVAGLAVRVGRTALAVQVDRALGTRGAASAALEVVEGRRASAFAGALVEDALAALREAGPARVVPRPRLPLAPWTLAAAVLVAVAGLLPWTLRDLFPARVSPDRLIAVLGGELEESGRRLEQASLPGDLREGLELSRELQQLGQELAMQELPAEELSRRLAEMEQRVGQEYELLLQRFRDASRPPGDGAGEGPAARGGDAEPAPGTGEDDPGGDQFRDIDPAALPPEARELAQALDLLRELKQRTPGRSGGGEGPAEGGGGGAAGGRTGEGAPGGQPGEGLAGDGQGGGEGDAAAAPTAGTAAVADERGPATDIVRGASGESLDVEAPVGEGETARMLVRALPQAGTAAVGEERALAEYRRQAESALAAEEVPVGLRDYVRRYFAGVGMLGD